MNYFIGMIYDMYKEDEKPFLCSRTNIKIDPDVLDLLYVLNRITTAANQWLITINRLADNHQPFGS